MQEISQVTVLVRDYDEAIAFYRDALGFELVANTQLGPGKQWVTVGPRDGSFRLLLAKAANEQQASQVGDQAGGRVFLFLRTDDFREDYATMRARGVVFEEEPREEPYGTVAVFQDLYGNRWDLIGPASPASSN